MAKICEKIEPLLAGFVDDELETGDRDSVQTHLTACADCAEVVRRQRVLKEQIHSGFTLEPTPATLRMRIHRDLTNQTPRNASEGLFALLWQAWQVHKLQGAFVLAILLVLIALPYYFRPLDSGRGAYVTSENTESVYTPRFVIVKGELICLDCEFLHRTGMRVEHTSSHRIGLQADDGKIWSFLQSPEGKKLLEGQMNSHRRLQIEGYAIPGAALLDVRSFSKI